MNCTLPLVFPAQSHGQADKGRERERDWMRGMETEIERQRERLDERHGKTEIETEEQRRAKTQRDRD